VEGDKRRNTQKRIATIEVRFSPVTINSHQYIDKRHPEKINLYAIEAREVGEDIANPIHWRFINDPKSRRSAHSTALHRMVYLSMPGNGSRKWEEISDSFKPS